MTVRPSYCTQHSAQVQDDLRESSVTRKLNDARTCSDRHPIFNQRLLIVFLGEVFQPDYPCGGGNPSTWIELGILVLIQRRFSIKAAKR
jgi:hypothetical protein